MKFVSLIVGCVVGIILIGSLLVPTVTSQPDGNVTYTNDGVRMSPVGDDEITISYDGELHWTIAGTTYDAAERPITQGTIMFYGVGHSTRTAYMYINSEGAYSRHNVMNGDVDTIVYHGSSKTVDITTTLASNGNTYSSTYTYVGEVYYYDPSGDYAWFAEKPTTAYISDDWDKFNTWSVGSTNFYAIIGEDIMVDGVLSPEGVTYSAEINSMDGVTGVKTIESYTINIPDQEPINCRGYILPYQVSGVNESQKSMYDLMALLIPIFIIGLVVMVAYVFISRDY